MNYRDLRVRGKAFGTDEARSFSIWVRGARVGAGRPSRGPGLAWLEPTRRLLFLEVRIVLLDLPCLVRGFVVNFSKCDVRCMYMTRVHAHTRTRAHAGSCCMDGWSGVRQVWLVGWAEFVSEQFATFSGVACSKHAGCERGSPQYCLNPRWSLNFGRLSKKRLIRLMWNQSEMMSSNLPLRRTRCRLTS